MQRKRKSDNIWWTWNICKSDLLNWLTACDICVFNIVSFDWMWTHLHFGLFNSIFSNYSMLEFRILSSWKLENLIIVTYTLTLITANLLCDLSRQNMHDVSASWKNFKKTTKTNEAAKNRTKQSGRCAFPRPGGFNNLTPVCALYFTCLSTITMTKKQRKKAEAN